MDLMENIVKGMQERAKTELQDYELFAKLYATDREAFERERKRQIALFINNEKSDDCKKLLQETQSQWDAILHADT